MRVKDVAVHRFQVLKDLIEEFKALEREEVEDGRDLGVVREVITF